MHRSKKNDPCIVTTLEGTPGTPIVPGLPFSLPFQSWKPGVILPLEITQLLQLQGTPTLLWGPLFPSFRSLEPWREHSSRTAGFQGFCSHGAAFCFLNGPQAVLELWPSPRSLGAPGCDFQCWETPGAHLLLSRHQTCNWMPRNYLVNTFLRTPLCLSNHLSPSHASIISPSRKNRGGERENQVESTLTC